MPDKIDNIKKSISVLHPDGELFEIRMMRKSPRKWNASGYFTSAETAGDALKDFARKISNGTQIYITLNKINSACYSRQQKDIFIENASPTTNDGDIVRLSWLFIDLDPARPADISSSNEELELAKGKMADVYLTLNEMGFQEPIAAESGNGCHLLYAIDLDNTPDNVELVKRCLEQLSSRFSDERVKLDTVNYNPARICKLYGTKAAKGSNTEERPHRDSEIISVPNEIKVNPRSLLEKLAGENEASAPRSKAPASITPTAQRFDLVDFMQRHGMTYNLRTHSGRDGSDIYALDECPFDSAHTNGDAKIFQYADGAISFTCHHNSCQGKTWQDVRLLYEPDAYDVKRNYVERPQYKKSDKSNLDFSTDILTQLGAYSISSLTDDERKPPDFLVSNLVPVGLTFLSGAPKIRKSFMALQLAAAVATGTDFLGFKTKKCDVVYFDLEGSKSRAATRSERMSQQVPDNVYIIHRTDVKLADGLVDTIQALHKQNDGIRLFIIDTYSRARGEVKTFGANAYDSDVAFLEPLQQMAIDENVAVLCVHHDKKGAAMAQDSFERLSGTMGISGSADCVLNLVAKGKRFEGTASFEYSPRDAIGGEIDLMFDNFSCEWKKDVCSPDIIGNPIMAYCIKHAPSKGDAGIFASYTDVCREAYGLNVERPSDEVARVVKMYAQELHEKYHIGIQLGARTNNARGIRIVTIA